MTTRLAYRLRQAAELVGVSEDFLRNMITSGALKATRISGGSRRQITLVSHAELLRVFCDNPTAGKTP